MGTRKFLKNYDTIDKDRIFKKDTIDKDRIFKKDALVVEPMRPVIYVPIPTPILTLILLLLSFSFSCFDLPDLHLLF